MRKIKLALDVVEDLKKLAGSIESLVKALQAGDQELEPKKVTKAEPITLEKVRSVLAEKSQSGKQPKIKALITKFGANKLTDINPDYYQELLEEAEQI